MKESMHPTIFQRRNQARPDMPPLPGAETGPGITCQPANLLDGKK